MKSKRFISLSVLSVLSVGLFAGALVTERVYKQDSNVEVSEAWDINVQPSASLTYYSTCDGKTGTALKSALAAFNKPTNPSYDWPRYEAADEAQDDSTSILCVYTRHNIKKNAHVSSGYSWDKWNREHVYTQSDFPNSKTDNHNIFACEGQINNIRGDLKYAELKGKGGSQVSVFGHTTNCYVSSSYFEPCDEAKGEIARACLYCTIYYGYNLTSIFDSADTCLKWNANFTVSPREIYRNNIVQGLQGNRNPFIDHPSYAQAIYGGPAYSGTDPLGPQDPVSVTGVSLNKSQTTLEINGTEQLTATVAPSNATNKAVTWTSSNNNIATVSSSGLVTAKASGNATITVTTSDGGFTASCNVTVNESKLSSISLSGNYQTSFIIGSSFSYSGLIVTARYTSGESKTVTNYSVTTPDMSSLGSKTVTVSYTENGVTKTATYTITVTSQGGAVTGVSLDKSELSLNVGASYQLVATVSPSDATNKKVTWSSNNPEVVSISISGEVTALKAGNAIITVTTVDGGFTATCNVTVTGGGSSSSGCGGSIMTTSIVLSTLSVLGIGLLLIKRKFVK